MARTGFWMRGAKGKFAGASFSSSPYGTIQRDIVPVRNPKTEKQAVQRMILATVAKTTAALRPLVDHSFESKQIGVKSVAHFQQMAMNTFRQAAAEYLNNPSSQPKDATGVFAIKGAPIVGWANNLILSQGRLSNILMTKNPSDEDIFLPVYATSALEDAKDYIDNLNSWGLVPGDQVTIVYYYRSVSDEVAEFDGEKSYADMYRYSRFVFKPVNEIDFTEPINFLTDEKYINPVLLKYVEGVQPKVNSSFTECYWDITPPSGYEPYGVAVVRSQKQANGKYHYSSSKFQWTNGGALYCDIATTYRSYMDNSTDINVGDELYLRHAEQV